VTATTADRNTDEVWNFGQIPPIPLTASTKIPNGVIVMVISGTGTALNGADTANGVVMGISTQLVDTALGHTKCPVRRGRFWFANSGNVTAAKIGTIAEVVDNQTVGISTDTTNHVKAGQIVGVDATKGVCVDMAGGQIGT
jgi:hypothetical protein